MSAGVPLGIKPLAKPTLTPLHLSSILAPLPIHATPHPPSFLVCCTHCPRRTNHSDQQTARLLSRDGSIFSCFQGLSSGGTACASAAPASVLELVVGVHGIGRRRQCQAAPAGQAAAGVAAVDAQDHRAVDVGRRREEALQERRRRQLGRTAWAYTASTLESRAQLMKKKGTCLL